MGCPLLKVERPALLGKTLCHILLQSCHITGPFLNYFTFVQMSRSHIFLYCRDNQSVAIISNSSGPENLESEFSWSLLHSFSPVKIIKYHDKILCQTNTDKQNWDHFNSHNKCQITLARI